MAHLQAQTEAAPPTTLLSDSFNTPNTPMDAVAAEVGGVNWQELRGVWEASSSAVGVVSATDNTQPVLAADVGQSDFTVTWAVGDVWERSAAYFPFRIANEDSMLFVTDSLVNSSIGLLKATGPAANTSLATTASGGPFASEDEVKIIANGTSIEVYRNDVLVLSHTTSELQTETKVGFASYRSGGSGGLNVLWDLIEVVG